MPTDPHGDADLPDLQPVGQRGPTDDLSDRVRERGDVAQGLGHVRDAVGVEAQPVLEGLRHALRPAALEVGRIGLEDPRCRGDECVGELVQRGVLLGPGQQGQSAGGHAGAVGELVDLLDDGGVDRLGHAPRVGRALKPAPNGTLPRSSEQLLAQMLFTRSDDERRRAAQRHAH